MPGLKQGINDTTIEVRALGATIPAPGKRRIWTSPELVSHSLMILTPEKVYLAPLGGELRTETLAAISNGGDMDSILGPLAIAIDLVAVSRMNIDLVDNSLAIEYLSRG